MGIFDDKAKELAGNRIAKEQEQKNAQEIYSAKERMVNSAMDIFLKNDLSDIMREYVAAAEKAHTRSIEIEIKDRFAKKKTVVYFAGVSHIMHSFGDWASHEWFISKEQKCFTHNYYNSNGNELRLYFEQILFDVYALHPKYNGQPCEFEEYNPFSEMNSVEEMLSSLNLKFKEYLLTCL